MEWRDELKKLFLYLRYLLKRFRRTLAVSLPLLFFFLTAFIFLVILIPSALERIALTLPRLGPVHEYVLEGTITRIVRQPDGGEALQPVDCAVVEVGGFRTVTGDSGLFVLRLQAEANESIPVCVTAGTQTIIRRVTLDTAAIPGKLHVVIK